jgi:hypothetical protein
VTSATGAELRLDDQLEQLAAGIVARIGSDPPDVRERMLAPQLRVIKRPPGINSFSMRLWMLACAGNNGAMVPQVRSLPLVVKIKRKKPGQTADILWVPPV